MIFTSPHGSVPIPQDQTIWSVLEQQAIKNADKPALICGITDRSLSFAEALHQARLICAGLVAHGIKKGDVVVLHSFNTLEYPLIFMALNRLGAICSTSSPLFNANELASQIEIAEATAVISHKMFAQVALDAAAKQNLKTENVITFGNAPGSHAPNSIEEMVAKNLPFPDLPPVDPTAIAALPFSSGTTARPKGVMLSGRAMLATAVQAGYIENELNYMIGVLPFFHILATMIFHVTIQRGFGLVILPRFDPETFLRAIEKYQIELLSLAPPIVQFLAKHPIVAKYDLSKVQYIGTGGSALPLDVEDLVHKRLGVTVMQGYGMTEFAGPIAYPTSTQFRPGSTGLLMPNTDLKIKDLDTDKDVGVNEVGELLFRSPSAMNGYFKDEEANRVAFAEDGFIRTGDVGYIDADGYVYIVDRLKEMIKYKGHQVSPVELDDVLSSHPAVDEACCVRGQDSQSREEIPKAYVVLHEGSTVTADELIAYVASKVAGYKKVREVEFIDAIPKSISGKSLRKDLQARENEKIKLSTSNLPGTPSP